MGIGETIAVWTARGVGAGLGLIALVVPFRKKLLMGEASVPAALPARRGFADLQVRMAPVVGGGLESSAVVESQAPRAYHDVDVVADVEPSPLVSVVADGETTAPQNLADRDVHSDTAPGVTVIEVSVVRDEADRASVVAKAKRGLSSWLRWLKRSSSEAAVDASNSWSEFGDEGAVGPVEVVSDSQAPSPLGESRDTEAVSGSAAAVALTLVASVDRPTTAFAVEANESEEAVVAGDDPVAVGGFVGLDSAPTPAETDLERLRAERERIAAERIAVQGEAGLVEPGRKKRKRSRLRVEAERERRDPALPPDLRMVEEQLGSSNRWLHRFFPPEPPLLSPESIAAADERLAEIAASGLGGGSDAPDAMGIVPGWAAEFAALGVDVSPEGREMLITRMGIYDDVALGEFLANVLLTDDAPEVRSVVFEFAADRKLTDLRAAAIVGATSTALRERSAAILALGAFGEVDHLLRALSDEEDGIVRLTVAMLSREAPDALISALPALAGPHAELARDLAGMLAA